MTPGPVPDWIVAWIEGQRQAVHLWSGSQAAVSPAAPLIEAWSRFGDQGTLAGGFTQLAGWLQSFQPGGSAGLPGIGPLREQQELAQSLALAFAEYQRLAAEMTAVLGKIHADTLDLLVRRVAEQANSGHPVQDFKGLYDLWVECGEVTYGKVATSESYSRLQADLGNAGVRVQGLEQQLIERWLKQLDLPTRSELNTLHRRVRELQRRLDEATDQANAPSGAAQDVPVIPAPRPRRPRKQVRKP